MTSILRPWLGGLALLAACDADTVRFPPDFANEWSTTTFADQLQLRTETMWLGCSPRDDALSFEVQTWGPAGGGTISLFGDTSWSETHDLVLVDTAPNGAWDTYTVGPLVDQVPQSEFVANTNTTFDCAVTPTAIVLIEDRFGVLADCVVIDAGSPYAAAMLDSPDVVGLGGCRTAWSTYSYY